VSILSRQQLDHIRVSIATPPRRRVKRKGFGLLREAKKEGLARRRAAHAKAFDAVVAGRPLKPEKVAAGG
jgi:hypothetical protein